MSNEPKITAPIMSPTEVFIDGKSYTLKQLRRYINFYNDHQIERGQTQCPLCGSYYDDNKLFVCDECGNLLSADEECTEHNHWDMTVCQECCLECSKQKACDESVNHKIDIARGK